MKPVLVAIAGIVGLALIMIVVDVVGHDATLGEALHESPKLVGQYLQWVVSLAWQYKFSTAVVVVAGLAILYVRVVPGIRSR